MKKILITGADSYIGTSFEKWLGQQRFQGQYQVDTLDMRSPEWKQYDMSGYDSIFHVAGIAHSDIGKISEETAKKYYQVNTDLTIETAKMAKEAGVNHFIFMSSIIVYGQSAGPGKDKHITKQTVPAPANAYGDSKLQADIKLQQLRSADFKVCILRPPMIYGKGCRGNYGKLAGLARRTKVFPDIRNQRSMLYIGNLCSFVRRCVEQQADGIFFPQNCEYVCTSSLVKEIARLNGKNLHLYKWLNPFVKIAAHIPGKIGGMTNKVFGSLTYEQTECVDEYPFIKTVELTERTNVL